MQGSRLLDFCTGFTLKETHSCAACLEFLVLTSFGKERTIVFPVGSPGKAGQLLRDLTSDITVRWALLNLRTHSLFFRSNSYHYSDCRPQGCLHRQSP